MLAFKDWMEKEECVKEKHKECWRHVENQEKAVSWKSRKQEVSTKRERTKCSKVVQ